MSLFRSRDAPLSGGRVLPFSSLHVLPPGQETAPPGPCLGRARPLLYLVYKNGYNKYSPDSLIIKNVRGISLSQPPVNSSDVDPTIDMTRPLQEARLLQFISLVSQFNLILKLNCQLSPLFYKYPSLSHLLHFYATVNTLRRLVLLEHDITTSGHLLQNQSIHSLRHLPRYTSHPFFFIFIQ